MGEHTQFRIEVRNAPRVCGYPELVVDFLAVTCLLVGVLRYRWP